MAKMYLSPDFKEFIELLNEKKVKYLVVGAYAVGVHGHVRNTGDLDIWIAPSVENAELLMVCLKDFGFGSLSGLSIEDFTKEDSVVQFGYPPFRIDIMTSVSGLLFNTCFEKKTVQMIDGVNINFVDLESLKKNKASTGRAKDLGDLENLP